MKKIISNTSPPTDRVYVNDIPAPAGKMTIIVARKGGNLYLMKYISNTAFLVNLVGVTSDSPSVSGASPVDSLEKALAAGFELFLLDSIGEIASLT